MGDLLISLRNFSQKVELPNLSMKNHGRRVNMVNVLACFKLSAHCLNSDIAVFLAILNSELLASFFYLPPCFHMVSHSILCSPPTFFHLLMHTILSLSLSNKNEKLKGCSQSAHSDVDCHRQDVPVCRMAKSSPPLDWKIRKTAGLT